MARIAMNATVFREYDIRGEVGKDFKLEDVYDLGRALAFYYLTSKQPQFKTIAIARDGRVHSPAIEADLIQACIDSGLNVISLGLCPSPVLYFALHELEVDGGLIITASHNPGEDNGLKICCGTDELSGAELQELRRCFEARKKIETPRQGMTVSVDIISRYLDWLLGAFAHLKGCELPLVIDCGNGAGGAVIPELVSRLDFKKATILYAKIDGTFPHHDADPTKIANMRDVEQFVTAHPGTWGFGLDGDADRCGIMTPDGHLLGGDMTLAIFGRALAHATQSQGTPIIVHDLVCSQALARYVGEYGVQTHMGPVGHTHIKKLMKTHDAVLGGEISGHFMFTDRYFGYDDGIYALLRFCEIILTHPEWVNEMREVFNRMHSSPEMRINCPDDKKLAVVAAVKEHFAQDTRFTLVEVDGVRIENKHGWALVRASNTQPKLSLRFEADTHDNLNYFKTLMREVLSYHELSFK